MNDLELYIATTAKIHDASTFHRLRSIPGVGKILALVMLYEIHDIARFPTVQDFLSYSRLIKCAHESNGKHYGYGGAKIGSVHLKWAFSEAAVLFLRQNSLGQSFFARLEQKHGKAKALTVLAHKLGRAVYFMLHRNTAFDLKKFVGQASTPPRLGLRAQGDDTATIAAPHPAALPEGAARPASPPRSGRALAARASSAQKAKGKNNARGCPTTNDLDGGKGVATPQKRTGRPKLETAHSKGAVV